MRAKILIIVSVVILIGAVIFGGIYFRRQSYVYESPRRGKIVEAIYGQGKVKTDKFYELKLGVTATAKQIFVSEGDRVKADDKLLMTESDLTFTAPFSGLITFVGFHENETLLPNVPLLRLENRDNRFIEVSMEQQGALRVKPELPAKIIFESLRAKKYQGKVASVYTREDEFVARIDVDKLSPNILTGMTADVAIVVGEINDALLVPLSAIDNGKVTVKREGNRLRKKIDLKIGKVDGSWAEVLSGDIRMDDQILIRNVVK